MFKQVVYCWLLIIWCSTSVSYFMWKYFGLFYQILINLLLQFSLLRKVYWSFQIFKVTQQRRYADVAKVHQHHILYLIGSGAAATSDPH